MTETRTDPDPPQATEFLRRLLSGIEDGLDPLSAADGAASALPKAVRDALTKVARRMTGEYREDEWGLDEDFAEAVYPAFEFLYDVWWRVQTEGVRNVPSHGRGLIVSNHAGSMFPFDATMLGVAIQKEHPLPRWTRPLVLNWAFDLPFLSFFMRKVGGVPASPFNATRLLEQDELVMVFPEGVKGTGKPFKERYRLQRFGRGGFVEVALRTGAPIIPVAVVGSEEIYPMIGDSPTLARMIGAPFAPVTPTFPLPRAARPDPAPLALAHRVLRADRRLRVRPGGGRRQGAPVRHLRAGPGDDPGQALREPGQARLGVPLAAGGPITH